MPKQNDNHSKANRRTKKNSNKKTFKKYGKNTSRGLRIKLDQMMKHGANIKGAQGPKQSKKTKKNKKRHKNKQK